MVCSSKVGCAELHAVHRTRSEKNRWDQDRRNSAEHRQDAVGPGMWETYPQHLFTPIETVVSAVEMLVGGGSMRDSKGKEVDAEQADGLAVEVFMDHIFFREEPEPCNDDMKEVLYSLSYDKKMEAMKIRAQEG